MASFLHDFRRIIKPVTAALSAEDASFVEYCVWNTLTCIHANNDTKLFIENINNFSAQKATYTKYVGSNSRVKVGLDSFYEKIMLLGARIDQNEDDEQNILEDLHFSNYIFNVDISLNNLNVANLLCRDTTFIKNFNMSGCYIRSSCNIQDATFAGKVLIDDVRTDRFEILSTNINSIIIVISSNIASIRFDNSVFKSKFFLNDCSIHDTSSFINCIFKDETSFNGTQFAKPPKFFGAHLHEGTEWQLKRWPECPTSKDHAKTFCAAYERLKLEMDRLKKHEDELDFFALELQCRRVMGGFWKGIPILFYGLLSNYGRSYKLPFAGLLVTAFAPVFCWWNKFGEANLIKSIGVSLANTLAVFNFRKDFVAAADLQDLSPFLTTIAAGQTLFGILFMFLLGLALRNHMRMK